ncbi:MULTISPECIES: TetR/AcrR family transcriptional regulator [Actinomycetes]|uniref:TetR/AcrR family transcriptional regulator n=1 Tax=Actinomycetes TaxID=1760 RepID=UPI0004C077EB|nr:MULTISPECIES: TetR/AcrR family transcriptional regulator [Actinomycetes]
MTTSPTAGTPTPAVQVDAPAVRIDPRIQRSREALINAAGELLAEREPDRISITDIAQRAGVSRPTVYQHFADKESALAAVIQVRLEHILRGERVAAPGLPSQDEAVGRIYALVSEISRSRNLYHLLIESTVGTRARVEISKYIYGLVADYIERAHPDDKRDHEELARFVTGGAIALLEHWASKADIDSEEERRVNSERIWILLQHACSVPPGP